MKTNRETHFVAWPILIRKLSRNYGLAADTLVYGAISPYISVFAWAHSRSPMPIARVRILFHFFFFIICCSCNCCLRVRFTRAPAFYDTLSFSHRNFSTNTHFVRIVSNNLFMCISATLNVWVVLVRSLHSKCSLFTQSVSVPLCLSFHAVFASFYSPVSVAISYNVA